MDHSGTVLVTGGAGYIGSHTVRALRAAGREVVVIDSLSSSCSVYGTPERVPVTEDAAVVPESVYAETKATVERMLGWYGITSGLQSVSLRYFNAAGASSDCRIGEDWNYSINLVPLVMKAVLLEDHRLQVFGVDYDTPDGTCIRDYIRVEDLADAHLRALQYIADGGPTVQVNLGTGIGSSVFDVVRATERVSGREVPHDVVGRRPGDPVATFADPTRARELLGWSADRGLDEIVQSAFDWHRSQV